jgi:hypothetical protein
VRRMSLCLTLQANMYVSGKLGKKRLILCNNLNLVDFQMLLEVKRSWSGSLKEGSQLVHIMVQKGLKCNLHI